MGVNENRQSGLDEAIQVGSAAAKVVEGAAKAGKITAAAANGTALGGPYGAAASVAIAAAKHGKKILLALLAILAIPLLFLVMLPTLIFGGTAQNSGDTTILNDQAAITENMNEIAFAVSDLLGSGIADAEQRLADDFAASSADQYEIVNPYENERINNVNLFISQYCAYWCSGSGSYHALIPAAAEAWGLPVSGCTASEPQRITDALSSGKLIVAIMSAGHFTSSGHFIVLRGVKDEKILVADPASRTRSEQGWELSIILNEASKAAGSGGPFWIIG